MSSPLQLTSIENLLMSPDGTFYFINGYGQFQIFNIPTSVQNGYKSFVANLVQESTNAPDISVLYNDLGCDIISSYDNIGSYILTASSDVFVTSKTFVMLNQSSADIVYAQKDPNSLNKILIGSSANDILNQTLEIRVYN